MKKIFFLLAAMVAMPMMAETQMLVDSIVDFDAEGAASKKEAYVYNASGEATMWYEYDRSNDDWAISYTYQLSYEYSNGRISLRKESLSTGSGWVLMNRTHYTYDEQGRLAMESRESLSAVGQTWSEIKRMVYEYGEDGVPNTILYQFGGGEDYLSYLLVPESSTADKRVYDIYWTGFEEEGSEGQRIYYVSEHEVTPAQGMESVSEPSVVSRKLFQNGQLLILRGNKQYSITGVEQ